MNKKKKSELMKRYLLLLIGLFINAFGVSFITKACLGTSPISSIPYTLSLEFPFSMGQFTLMFNLLLIILQIILLRKKFTLQYWLEIPVTYLFSVFIDFTMSLLGNMNLDNYTVKMLSLILGCFILAFGVALEFVANVVMLPGEAFVNAICCVFKKDMGKTKVIFDFSMTFVAVILNIAFFYRLAAVREGTLISAILVGTIARIIKRKIEFIENYLTGEQETLSSWRNLPDNSLASQNVVITISREFGSGGRQIGETLAKDLGFDFYDKNIIGMAAKESNLPEEYIEEKEQTMTNSFLYDLVAQYYSASDGQKAPLDKLFEAETKVIREVAKKGNCVIVGRCADYILRNFPNCYNVFLYANDEFRTMQIMQRENMDKATAKKHMKEVNRKRFIHYKYYTGKIMGLSQNYHLCIDTSQFGIDGTVEMIKSLLKSKKL